MPQSYAERKAKRIKKDFWFDPEVAQLLNLLASSQELSEVELVAKLLKREADQPISRERV